MPVTFLNPGLLLGAAAAAVPIVLHLLNRRRVREIRFSDLRFLEEVQVQRSRSLGLHRLLLLLLRVLAILLIALAVARPRLAGLAPGEAGDVSMLVVLDASASMQTAGEAGTRFAAAVDYAATTAADLAGGGEIQVLLADDEPRAVFGDWTRGGTGAAGALRELAPADGGFDLAAALSDAAEWARNARHRPALLLVLSDFQLASWDAAALARAAAELTDAGVEHVLVRAFGQQRSNGGVRDVRLPLRALQSGETLLLKAEVLVGRPDQPFWLEFGGERVAETVASARPGEIDSLVFALTAPGPGEHAGLVATEADRFAVDDARPFVLGVRDSIEVLLVHGEQDLAAGRGGWRYWQQALAPGAAGDGPSADRSVFRIRSLAGGELETGDLERADLFVYLDAGPLGRGAGEALADWLRAGGGAVFQFGDYNLAGYLSGVLLPMLGVDGDIAYRNRSETGAEEARITDRRHPLFRGLSDPALDTLERARWRRQFALQDSGLAVLMTGESGTPLLATGGLGDGRFALLPFNLSAGSADLARNPMFLPLAQRLAALMAGGGGAGERNLIVGAVPRLTLEDGESLGEAPAVVPSGARIDGHAPLTARMAWERGAPVIVGETARRAGFYTFVDGRDTLGVVAVAPPPAEGDPRLRTPEDVLARLAAAGLETGRDLADIEADAFAAALQGRELAPLLLLLAILSLLAETALSRRAR